MEDDFIPNMIAYFKTFEPYTIVPKDENKKHHYETEEQF